MRDDDLPDYRVLDPATATAVPGVDPRTTVYVGPRLLVSSLVDVDAVVALLRAAAAGEGWLVQRPDDDPKQSDPEPLSDDELREIARRLSAREWPPSPSEPGTRVGVERLELAMDETLDRAGDPPDGWALLQEARARFGTSAMRGVGLDHLVFLGPAMWGPNPAMWGPNPAMWGPNPAMWGPNPAQGPASSYGFAGSGGRQPVTFAGLPPGRCDKADVVGRRPVVAVLDTGCGAHDWLDDVVELGVKSVGGAQIGLVDDVSDPESVPDQVGGFDGLLDPYSGHGTFICGLVRQACPDARILAWRVMNTAGPIPESALIGAMDKVLELVESHQADESTGSPIDVLALSLGYYHETPEDADLVDPTVWALMDRFGRAGTAVFCSAGNDSTDRPLFPAAFGPWSEGSPPFPLTPDAVPLTSVGALNPNLRTDALFSNTGPWVRAWETGAAVVSTLPTCFQGGLQALAVAQDPYRGRRATIDPDDFRGGFAVWSGTSFAAPLLAGRLAQQLRDELVPVDKPARDAASARQRTGDALEKMLKTVAEKLKKLQE